MTHLEGYAAGTDLCTSDGTWLSHTSQNYSKYAYIARYVPTDAPQIPRVGAMESEGMT